TEGKECSVCGTETVAQEVIPVKPHTEVTVPGKEATCTATGLTDGKKCSVCGEVTVAQTATAMLKHTEVTVPGKAATCTATGLTDGKKCSVCGTVTVEQKEIAKAKHVYETITTKATTSKDGKIVKKCDCGDVKSTTTIKKASKISISKESATYTGKTLTAPTITVKDSAGKTIAKENYTISKPSKSLKNVGEYTYTIKFKGNYTGSKKVTFTIEPKATSVKKLTAAKKAFTVQLNKVSAQATGYEIMYATNSKFTKGKKTVKITSYKTTSKKISSLSAKKTYYVKVRTYKTVDGEKFYSDWSKVKTIKTK
ncbi:MAG: hypothetical protein IKU44_03050, partial [Firmicutes bacterium]|nr:hypothetical protein [Bacillota bacterium]